MNKTIQFGENVAGFDILVLNEREIRASSGILFVFMLIGIMLAIMQEDFLMLKYIVIIFFTDLLIRLLINPKYAPILILGRLFVRNQVPEYVGARQKKFAWYIGLALSGTILVLLSVLNSYSIFTGLSCMICLIFLFFETAFGICIGCIFYQWVYRDKAQYCPGEICEVHQKQDIQKTSFNQVLIVLLFLAYIITLVSLFNDSFDKVPGDLFVILNDLFN